jgi:hypothetical protein
MLEHILMGRYQAKNIENSRPILMESTGLAMDHQCCSRSRKYKNPQYSSVQVQRSSLEVFEQPLLIIIMMKSITRHEYLWRAKTQNRKEKQEYGERNGRDT